VPLAGSYTLYDPWESHYAEVARIMNATGDYLSPRWQDEHFWSKPAGHLWLLAFGMRLFGVGNGPPDEMVASTIPEWSLRLPVIVISIFGVWALWLCVSRLVSRRAGFIAALSLATMPQWAFITRQAMTDMPEVGLMTGGLALLFLALKDESAEQPLNRWRLGPLAFSAFHLLLLAVALLVLTQTIAFTFGLAKGFQGRRVPLPFAAGQMGFYVLCLLAFAVVGWFTVKTRRQALLVASYLAFALAVLMKGLLGVAIPGMVVVGYLIVSGEWRLLSRAELHLGVLVVMAVAFPWYHAMMALHGYPFFREMFIQHHFQRLAAGVHGDKGSFEYFIVQLAVGTFPWSGLAVAGVAHLFGSRRSGSPRDTAMVLGAVWFATNFTLFSMSMTKFHHYILPALPGLAIAIGIYLDDLVEGRIAFPTLGLGVAMGFFAFSAAMVIEKPVRLVWLFIYNYTRPFPNIRFGSSLFVVALLCALPLTLLLMHRLRRIASWLTLAAGLASAVFMIDVYMIRVAPHWGQKILIREYYRRRASPDERLIAWQMNWRGENFYTKGEIAGPRPEKWTVFMSLDNTQMLSYLRARPGRKFFFILEHTRLGTLKRILPTERAKETFRIEEDQTNNKFLLASATI